MLKSAHIKFARAEEHLDALDEAIREYFDSEPRRLDLQTDDDGGGGVLEVEIIRDFPDRVAVLAGDSAHNLRCVLDHIAYAVSAGSKKRRSFFPVCASRDDYFGPRKDNRPPLRDQGLGGVSRRLLTVFDSAQPFQRGKDAKAHPLACLARLDNADKHRTIQPALAIAQELSSILIQVPPTLGATEPGFAHTEWHGVGERLAVGKKTRVFSWRIDPKPPDGDVRVRIAPNLSVSFGEHSTMTDLLAARDFIRDGIIGPLEAEIG